MTGGRYDPDYAAAFYRWRVDTVGIDAVPRSGPDFDRVRDARDWARDESRRDDAARIVEGIPRDPLKARRYTDSRWRRGRLEGPKEGV